MKDFFKKHPELLYLLIGVIIVDCIMMYVWMGDKAATENSGTEIDRIRSQATKINDSTLAITEVNAAKALDEKEKWKKAYSTLYTEESTKYELKTQYKNTMIDATAKKVITSKVNYLIDELLQDKNKTSDSLSFAEFKGNVLFSLKKDQVKRIFEILAVLEELVKICDEAEIVSLEKVSRPLGLDYSVDSLLNTKSYRFEISATVTAEGVKRLMNRIVSDKAFYFEINGFSLKAEEQIDVTGDDIIPKIQRSAVVDKSRPGIDSELDQLQRNFNGNSEKETGAVKTQEESIAPFTDAIVKLELIIDWVQFPGGVK